MSIPNLNCLQYTNRRTAALYNVPPTRYTPVSPYFPGGPTQYDLNMRRKAEILQYKKRESGSLSQRQNFAQNVRGNLRRALQTECLTMHVPSTNAGVPGPPIMLYLDPAVPLYNYVSTYTYAVENVESNEQWGIISSTDISGNRPTILRFIVRPIVNQINYLFSIVTPVAITVNGFYTPSVGQSGQFTVRIFPSDISITVYYAGEIAYQFSTPTVSFSEGFLSTVTGTISPANNGAFSGTIYLGNITINDLRLATTAGFTYDIVLNYNQSNSTNSYVSDFTSTFVSNLAPDFNKKTENNMQFTVAPPSTSISPIAFSGI